MWPLRNQFSTYPDKDPMVAILPELHPKTPVKPLI